MHKIHLPLRASLCAWVENAVGSMHQQGLYAMRSSTNKGILVVLLRNGDVNVESEYNQFEL